MFLDNLWWHQNELSESCLQNSVPVDFHPRIHPMKKYIYAGVDQLKKPKIKSKSVINYLKTVLALIGLQHLVCVYSQVTEGVHADQDMADIRLRYAGDRGVE